MCKQGRLTHVLRLKSHTCSYSILATRGAGLSELLGTLTDKMKVYTYQIDGSAGRIIRFFFLLMLSFCLVVDVLICQSLIIKELCHVQLLACVCKGRYCIFLGNLATIFHNALWDTVWALCWVQWASRNIQTPLKKWQTQYVNCTI